MLKGIVIVIRFGDFGIDGMARKGAPDGTPREESERNLAVLNGTP